MECQSPRTAAVLAILLAAASATAAQSAGSELVVDPAGDVVVGLYSVPGGAPISDPEIDLLSLSFDEGPESIELTVKTGAMPGSSTAQTSGADAVTSIGYWLEFKVDGQDFVVTVNKDSGTQGTTLVGTLYQGTRASLSNPLPIPMRLDARLPGFVVSIDRQLLAVNGSPPVKGSQLEISNIDAYRIRPAGQEVWVGDQARPNAGQAIGTFELREPQTGVVALQTETPYYYSNGLASSYAYLLGLTSADGRPHEITLQVRDGAASWQFALPRGTIHVPAKGPMQVPVVAVVPFFHQHGARTQFHVDAIGSDATLGTIDLGIIYTTIPQPAGHHNQLYVHSLDGGVGGYFNTLPEDDADTGEPIGPLIATNQQVWELPLNPGLAIGLDFDLQRMGQLSASFQTVEGFGNASLSGNLLLRSNGQDVVLANITPTDWGMVSPNTEFSRSATISPLPDADYVPYAKDAKLLLQVTLGVPLVGIDVPGTKLLPSATFDLPLFDFHDQIQSELSALSSLNLTVDRSATRQANAGGRVVFPVSITNEGKQDRNLKLNLTTNPANEGRLHEQGPVLVKAGASTQVHAIVEVPSNTPPGSIIDALLTIEDGKGAFTFQRLAVLVQAGDSIPSDDVQAPESAPKESPPISWMPTMGVLLALAFARRRR